MLKQTQVASNNPTRHELSKTTINYFNLSFLNFLSDKTCFNRRHWNLSILNKNYFLNCFFVPKNSLVKARGQIFSQGLNSLQTRNYLIPYYDGAFLKEFLFTSKIGISS
jgi:hypothetical protein